MRIDFSPVHAKTILASEFSQSFTIEDFHAATNESIDTLLDIVRPLHDADIAFIPFDPDAHDALAPESEQNIGWSVGHLIVHVTASSEEYATLASLIARSIPYGREPRLRFETDWHTVTTVAQCVQRLEESRRMRLGYLAAFPDAPDFTLVRAPISPRYIELFGEQDLKTTFLMGLIHETEHYPQIHEAARQAVAARIGQDA